MTTLPNSSRFQKLVNDFANIKDILVVGDVGIDKYTSGSVARISPEAPVPIVEVNREWEKLGLAANISHNLKDLGVKSTLCGVVGEDDKAKRFESLLEEAGLSTWGIVHDPSRPTIFKERITTPTQQVCRIDYESKAGLDVKIENKILERVSDLGGDAQAIILEDYAKGLLTPKVLRGIIDKFKDTKTLVAVDPGRTTPPLYYKGADLLKPNLVEAKMMVESLGHTYKKLSIEEMANILVDKLDLKKLVITLGKDGMALFDRENSAKISIIPTAAVEVFDVSGAGDTTISLLIAALVSGATLEEAGWIGNCGAGVVVAKKGTATVNMVELLEHYHQMEAALK